MAETEERVWQISIRMARTMQASVSCVLVRWPRRRERGR